MASAALQHVSINAELDRGFSLMKDAIAAKHTGRTAEGEQSLHAARVACETAEQLVAELPDEEPELFEMRLNALRSLVFDSSGAGLKQATAHG